ncbi:MAG TPA: hypothetical protein VMR25_09165 [Planctomycetaceae bacterium]|jgi:hypothetical protein|nr:hypothetical protein [Planctomycetaceae bacterium]
MVPIETTHPLDDPRQLIRDTLCEQEISPAVQLTMTEAELARGHEHSGLPLSRSGPHNVRLGALGGAGRDVVDPVPTQDRVLAAYQSFGVFP